MLLQGAERWEGVVARVLTDEDEPAAASIENTSFCGLRWADITGVAAAIAPSFRGASDGLEAPVEFQRSAKASDIVQEEIG